MHGFLIIDKPSGVTSHDIVSRVRRKLRIRRVGHGGTLDPMATGIVPVAVGDATRLLEFFSDSDKGYSATMRLGETTDSQDAEGTVVASSDWQHLSCEEVEQAVLAMQGDIEQVPPMYSALKKNGVPLYKLARKGVEIERPPRPVTIRNIELTSCKLPEVSFDVVCSKGTYIRTLAHDIGDNLGCGAHLAALRRFQHGPYLLDQAVTLADFEAAEGEALVSLLIPLLDILCDFPLLELCPEAVARLLNGVPPQAEEVVGELGCQPGESVRLSDGERLLAVATYSPERSSEQRGDFELARVFTLGQ